MEHGAGGKVLFGFFYSRKEKGDFFRPSFRWQANLYLLLSVASRQAEILSRTHWDLVVYDEAHKLRNVYKSTPSMASRLKSAFSDSHKLLLTATPLQNNIEELYGLVSIIDDHYFGDLKSFKAQYCYSNKNDDIAFGDLRSVFAPSCIARFANRLRSM